MNTPIYNSIKKYIDANPVRFHMPGHKGGRTILNQFQSDFLELDLTEIPGLDNLHFPTEAIYEAQVLAAKAFGADETYFLVNGASCGVHAMIMTACGRGEKLIIGRDCHKAAINGMILAGIRPVYMKADFDESFGVPKGITPITVEAALKSHPDAAAVFITRPNYYGVCSDIDKISEIVHSYGKILLVDEAHGAHLRFSKRLPACAMDTGADICVQSAHKTLPALTQGAYLHCRTERINTHKLKYSLRMLQTTSPSYLIMASLDIARAIMEENGRELQDELLDNIKNFTSLLSEISNLRILSGEYEPNFKIDQTRIVISVKGLGISGYEAEKVMLNDYGVQIEMADVNNIVCISTTADKKECFDRLYTSLYGLSTRVKNRCNSSDILIKDIGIPIQAVELNEIGNSRITEMELHKALGRVSSDMVTPYPPGIPVLCPGETITCETIDYIENIMKSGGTVNGISAGNRIQVLE